MNKTEKEKQKKPIKTFPNVGTILRVTGTVIDVEFSQEATPKIFNELLIMLPASNGNQERTASIEVAQQLGDGVVRCIALENIFGISRGLPVEDTGSPIMVPVGDDVLGRVFDVLGRTIDEEGPLPETKKNGLSIEKLLLLLNKK